MKTKTPVRVLHIEDEDTDRQALLRMVRKNGLSWTVTSVGGLAEARARLRESRFDVIIADYHLPDGDGTELFDEVSDIPFVLITGTLAENLALRTLERGADDYLPKDTEGRYLEALPMAVEKTLHRQQLRDAEHRLARELRESEERLRMLIEGVRGYAIFMLHADGRVATWNRGAELVKGFSAEDIVGRHVSICYSPEAVAAGKPLHALTVAAERGRYVEEGWFVRGDGSRFWANVTTAALRDENGRLRGFTEVAQDLTEHKKAEDELARVNEMSERARRLYETILSNTPDLIYVFDLRHRFTYANPALLQMWGRSRDEAIGKSLSELGYPDWHAAKHDAEIDRVIATKQQVRGEVPFTGTNGRRIYEYIFVPVLGADGTVEAVAGTTRDVTERKQSEEHLRKLAGDLAEADRRKNEFLAMLAHELRNPLAAIRTAADILGFGGSTADVTAILQRQTGHVVRLVNDLLDVSRIMQGKVELRRETVELAEIVNRAVEIARPLIDGQQHQFVRSLPSEPIWLDADPVRLAQAISNLLANAAKYTELRGTIRLSAETSGEEAVIRVQDNGIGIDAATLPRIFDLFAQAERSIDRSQGGLGLGLTVAKSLIETHGGSISARSEGPGKGSEFAIRMPVVRTPQAPLPVQPRPVAAAGRRILIVDDNADAALMLKMLFSKMGKHEIRVAHDGFAALEAVKDFRPELVLLDIGLPGLDGFAVAARLREQPETADVVLAAVTGYGTTEDRQRSREAGFDEHLVKPISFDSIRALLLHPNLSRH
jgi:PAS domain S-box-containing protein